MKTKSLSVTLYCVLFLSSFLFGQSWEKSSKVLGLGVGGSSFFYVNTGSRYYKGVHSPVTGQLNFQMEFGIHQYVGLGFQTGVGGGGPVVVGRRGWLYPYYNGAYNGSFNFPISLFGNFHFYQLIADKTGKNIHADKLDIYAGVNLGSGIGLLFFSDGTLLTPLAFGGIHAGARYYFTDKFGVNLELGYGKQIVNGGLVFKL